MGKLRLILGDQLSEHMSSLKDINKAQDTIFICEIWDEATYVKHHKKKIAFLFSAMRHFAHDLRRKGYRVEYKKLDSERNTGGFIEKLSQICARENFERLIVTKPGEYRLLIEIEGWEDKLRLPVEIRDDDRFLCSTADFQNWAHGRKQLRMEYFYREMRKRHNILMSDDKPVGGAWNFDTENRKPPRDGLDIPQPYCEQPDSITNEVLFFVGEIFADHFGDLAPFHFAVTREGALKALANFIDVRLPHFGDYQDAMLEGEPWMYHAHISTYLNCGLLLPIECIQAAERAFYNGHAPLNAVEGFIRQILGWREYVRGMYWLKMPNYAQENALNAQANLPEVYWTGQTKLNCLRQAILDTKKNAYAHHIQRLMILGNFALLAGILPRAVNEWFLIVYADAYEWVELPNVSGMALYADGGTLASKPYAAGGAYIHKMSNYCKNCSYKVSKKNGPDACPFNYLYWDFLARNRDKLQKNQRMGMIYRTLDHMSAEKRSAIREDSRRFLANLT